jgi:CNH domain
VKAINLPKVTQIAVLEEFSLFLVLSDKSLIAYHLDVVVPPPGSTTEAAVKQRPPQKLSGGKDVGFFATGRMKERSLVFYKKREGLSSTFKVFFPLRLLSSMYILLTGQTGPRTGLSKSPRKEISLLPQRRD